MFPQPNKISGDKRGLIDSYITQVSKLKNTDLIPNKNKDSFRFCSYNVRYFEFKNYTSLHIKEFIDKILPDAFSLIEYNANSDQSFKPLKDHYSVLFEQVPGYGINTFHLLESGVFTLHKKSCLNYQRVAKNNELRGFTHLKRQCYNTIINIITIHLDVTDETGNTRLKEIRDINDYIINNQLINVLIIGDFNEWNLDNKDPLYNDSLIDFRHRTGLSHFSTRVHDFLNNSNYSNVFHMKNKYPKFSCWSGKLVDFCYLFQPTWNNNLEIENIYMPFVGYSDHLPIIVDIKAH